MKDYIIYTDSACDIMPNILCEWGIRYSSLTYRFDGAEDYCNNEMSSDEFYRKMRDGGVAKTSAVNPEVFEEGFEKILKEGKDLLYIGFSSGLSSTYSSAKKAVEQLAPHYPEAKIFTIDSLSASAGLGLLLYLANEKKKSGASIEDTVRFCEDIKLNICHWFTVDDLVYLKRGGRISPTLAFVGNTLGLKPILHMDNEGHLVNVTKARGRKRSISALSDKLAELSVDIKNGKVFISHADCFSDAEQLSDMIYLKFGVKTDIITNVGTVIGAHSGPGTLALFFVGKER